MSDLCIRDVGLSPRTPGSLNTLAETARMTRSGSRITYAAIQEGFEASMLTLVKYFTDAKIVEMGSAVDGQGNPRSVIVLERQ